LFLPPGKLSWTYFITTGYSFKNLDPSKKTLNSLVSQAGYGPGPLDG